MRLDAGHLTGRGAAWYAAPMPKDNMPALAEGRPLIVDAVDVWEA